MGQTSRIRELARSIIEKGAIARTIIATAESCTGGMVGAALTNIPGSSAVFDRGFITYSNGAKIEMLGVAPAILAAHGAVSEQTARAMAKGALIHSPAKIAVSITGIAGPDGGTAEKPVGLVWFGLAVEGAETHVDKRLFKGGRDDIRMQATENALSLILEAISGQ